MRFITRNFYEKMREVVSRQALGLFPYAGITILENLLPKERWETYFVGYFLANVILREGHRLVYVDTKPLSIHSFVFASSFLEEFLPTNNEENPQLYYHNRFTEWPEYEKSEPTIFFFDGLTEDGIDKLEKLSLEGHCIILMLYGENQTLAADVLYKLLEIDNGILFLNNEEYPKAIFTFQDQKPIIIHVGGEKDEQNDGSS